MLASFIYNTYQSSKKKSKQNQQKRAPGGVFPEGQGPRPQKRVPQSANTGKPKSLDEIFAEMMKDQQGGSAEPRPQPRPAAPQPQPQPRPQRRPAPAPAASRPKKVDMLGREIFSYDDQYAKQKAKEIAQMEATGKPVRSKIEAAPALERVRKKRLVGKGFKFNAKDAIIYDIIMNRKY